MPRRTKPLICSLLNLGLMDNSGEATYVILFSNIARATPIFEVNLYHLTNGPRMSLS